MIVCNLITPAFQQMIINNNEKYKEIFHESYF